MTRFRVAGLLASATVLGVALLGSAGAASAAVPNDVPRWITLGTQGGPIASATRSQPANLLVLPGGDVLVDAGDGAAEQLAKAHVPLRDVHAILLTHLHFDHVGGLQAILGMRYQTDVPGVLTIYGPPGTKALVDGLVASMEPAYREQLGLPVPKRTPPGDTVRVIEVGDGATFAVSGVRVTAAANTHYSVPPGSPRPLGTSLSYRFDAPGRSIAFTGDTGPSAAVETLSRSADLLVAEMADVPALMAGLRIAMPDLPDAALQMVARQTAEHHLTPDELGKLAAASGAKELVVTHLVPGSATPAQVAEWREAIGRTYHGKVEFANDLDRF